MDGSAKDRISWRQQSNASHRNRGVGRGAHLREDSTSIGRWLRLLLLVPQYQRVRIRPIPQAARGCPPVRFHRFAVLTMHIKAKLAVIQYVREREGDFDFSQVTQAQLERLERT